MSYKLRGDLQINRATYLGRLTTIERTALIPTQSGAIVYDITLLKVYQWNGTIWELVGTSSTNIPNWTATTAYKALDVVVQGARLIRRIADGTSAATFTNTEAALWTLISNDVTSAWTPSTYYYQGEIATTFGKYIQRLTSGVSNALFLVPEAVNWELISSQVTQDYYSSAPIFVGERIKRNGSVLERNVPGIGTATFDAIEAVKWTPLSLGTTINFQANTFYYSGEKFISNGVVYRRFNNGVSGATFNAAEQVEWRVDGSDNNPIGSTTSTRTAASVTVGYDDSELILAPAGVAMNVALNSVLPDGKEFSFNGVVDSAKVITFTAGAGTTIEDPITHIAGASFSTSTWTNTAQFSFSVIKANSVWRLRGV